MFIATFASELNSFVFFAHIIQVKINNNNNNKIMIIMIIIIVRRTRTRTGTRSRTYEINNDKCYFRKCRKLTWSHVFLCDENISNAFCAASISNSLTRQRASRKCFQSVVNGHAVDSRV